MHIFVQFFAVVNLATLLLWLFPVSANAALPQNFSQEIPVIFGGRLSDAGRPIDQLIRKSTVELRSHFRTSSVQSSHCTGVVIAADTILTAAHCVKDSRAAHIRREYDWIEAEAFAIHKDYRFDANLSQVNDLAMLRAPSGTLAGYTPVVWEGPAKLRRGTSILAAGYGTASPNLRQDDGTGVLRIVELNISRIRRARFRVDQSSGRGLCSGDSGSPAFTMEGLKLRLVGIASSVRGACDSAADFETLGSFSRDNFIWKSYR